MAAPQPDLATAFTVALDRLGPFERNPILGLAVSGGADSMTLAILAEHWARQRAGSVFALVVDHSLRPASAAEALLTIQRLGQRGIPARLLVLTGLTSGPALAERARIARYEILTNACREAGILHLLLGHHAADQVETLAMRVLRGSRTHGLAAMSALLETAAVRLLRPLLGIEPARLRNFLSDHGVQWIEDPSNRDMHALRPRLRHRLSTGAASDRELRRAISSAGKLRSRQESAIAAELADRTTIRPEGFALLSPGRIGSAALGALVQTIAGARYQSSAARIAEIAARPAPATVGGVRILPAGRSGDGWLLAREEAAVMGPVNARPDTVWDHRFRLLGSFHQGATIGPLGVDAARFRGLSDLPAVVLRTLPAVRSDGNVVAVPHIGYAVRQDGAGITVLFTPRLSAAGPVFVPVQDGAEA